MLRRTYMLVCALNLLCVFAAIAQSKNGDMQGYVKNIDNQPIAYASVFLLKAADSSVIKFSITDQTGIFKFNGIAAGKYLVKVSCTGYNTKLSAINFLNGGINFNIVAVQLKKSSIDIAEIAVVESRNFMEVRPGKTTLNIQSSVFATGNTALNILKMSPGVQVDNNDNVLLNGKPDVLVLIDNKPTYLSGTALADLLQGTQSNMIDRIEIISNPNATYDAGSTGGVINIKLVRDKNVGFSAQVNATGGVVEPGVAGYDVGTKATAGVNFNYRTKKINVFGGYSYSNLPAFKSSTSSRVNNYNGIINLINDDWFIDQRRINQNFRLGTDYNIAPKHIIGFLVSGLFVNVDGPKKTLSAIVRSGSAFAVDSSIITNSDLNRWQSNITYNLNYRGNLGKAGDVTLDVDYINFDRHYNETILSNYYNSTGINFRNLRLQNNSPSNYDVYVLNAGYHLEINSNNTFSAGFKDSYARTDNVSDFGMVTSGVYNSIPMFTGRFKYTEMLYTGFVDYDHTFSKKASLELGLRLEQIITDGLTPNSIPVENVHNNYIDFFPNVQYNYLVNNNNQLRFSYRRSINRPKYEELNPFTVYSDQYTYQKGNPYLKPYYSNAIEINHVYKDKFSTSLSFSAINGFTQTIYKQDDKTQVTTLQKVNLGNRYNYGLEFVAPINFTKWYNVDFDLDFKYQQFTGVSDMGNLNSGSPDITLQAIQHFKLPLDIHADINASYETPTTFGIFRYKSNIKTFVGLNKSIFKKQGTIQFQVDNIFQTDKNIYTSHYQNLNISGTQPNSFRTFQISFSYALGSKTIKAARRNTAADEEQGRVGNGSN